MYLGIDLGTSGVKVTLIDDSQRVLGSETAGLTVQRPHPNWSEQDPADWIRATETALAALARAHDLAAVQGIGLSGQMHGAVALDASGAVLRPAILWNDTRSHAEAAELDAMPDLRRISGNIVFPGFTAPKLVWMARHEPDLFSRVATVLLPKDYLRLWLTGERVSEMSDASGTSWLDVAARDWSDAALAAGGMRRDQMPALVEGSAPSGRLRAELAARWGMGQAVVAGGAGDNAATAIGAGTVAPGQGFVSLGTSGVVFAASDRFLPAPETAVHAFCHALPQTWHQMGVILSASAAMEWLAGVLQAKPADLTAGLGALQAPGTAMFLPYLSGERTPHNDALAKGLLAGLTPTTDRAALTRAVLEGVTFALADNLTALRAAGADLDGLLALGGGARSDYWLRLIATTLNLPVLLPEGGDYGAAFGAARLGMMAATGASAAEICTMPRIAQEILPDAALVPAFAESHARFRALYPASRG
ncbi:xylulokinase [Paracoccus shanxieyensis]|uniref:Xylulose kinase n=1 Tax=Paracoccus shanxieyensis TaxID=2675752 RepID=A0A6L6J1E4_9RHOB|nr:xylulokinase [Paracoccus shanxieyensis]MTH65628.1 xylulokinase [Paracoccus shanxieyensis]MTH88797.1 xylulokinase [Paracoccus shanxieyensis]